MFSTSETYPMAEETFPLAASHSFNTGPTSETSFQIDPDVHTVLPSGQHTSDMHWSSDSAPIQQPPLPQCPSMTKARRYSGPLPYRPRKTKVDKSDHPCKICNKFYSNRKQLRKHVNSFHPEEPFEMTSKNLNLDRVNWCLESDCQFRHDRNSVFTKHLAEKHNIPMERVDVKFATFEEYERWKVEIEELRKIKFVAGDGYYWRLTKEGRRVSRQHLFCHKAKEFNTVGKKVALRMEGFTEDEIVRIVKPTWNRINESLTKETLGRRGPSSEKTRTDLDSPVQTFSEADGGSSTVDEIEVLRRLVPAKQNLIKTERTNSKSGCYLFSQCTAYLHVTIFEHDRSVHVDGCLTHYGHECVDEHDIFDLPESVVAKLKQNFAKGVSVDDVHRYAAVQFPQFKLKQGVLEEIRERNLRRILFKQYYAQFTNIFEKVIDISRILNNFYYVEPSDVLVTLLDIEHTLHDLHKQLVKKVNLLHPDYKPEKVFQNSAVDCQQILECLAMQKNFAHFKRLLRYAEHHKAFYMNHKVTKTNLDEVSDFDKALNDERYRAAELDQLRKPDETKRRRRHTPLTDGSNQVTKTSHSSSGAFGKRQVTPPETSDISISSQPLTSSCEQHSNYEMNPKATETQQPQSTPYLPVTESPRHEAVHEVGPSQALPQVPAETSTDLPGDSRIRSHDLDELTFPSEESLNLSSLPTFLTKVPPGAPAAPLDLSYLGTLPFGASDETGDEVSSLMLNFDSLFGPRTPQS